MKSEFTVVDLETTGLDPKRDKIIEIGALRVESGEITQTYETFVNPGCSLTDQVRDLTGISDGQLSDAPYISDVIDDVLSFAGDRCLLGHRVLFDYSFLKRAAVCCGHTFEREGVDTLKIARSCLEELPSKSLPALCEHFGIDYRPHRALEDARATYFLYRKLYERFGEEKKPCFVPRPLIYQVKKEVPVTKKQLEQIDRLLSCHGLTDVYKSKSSECYVDFTKMTRNEASRFIDRIILRHGRYRQEHVR